jgi:hypothetical protein
MGFDKRTQELAKVADICMISECRFKKNHAQSGAIVALYILKQDYWKDEKYNSDILKFRSYRKP